MKIRREQERDGKYITDGERVSGPSRPHISVLGSGSDHGEWIEPVNWCQFICTCRVWVTDLIGERPGVGWG